MLFGKVVLDKSAKFYINPRDMETTRLLKEVIANEIIIKSVVNSIFREREICTDGTPIGGLLSGGKLDDTPGYLIEYESRLLREAAK